MIKNLKAITPVVTTALIIVIAVVSVIGFQNWFGSYSSQMVIKTEKSSAQTSQTNIETLIGDQLYFKNTFDDNVSIKQIKLGTRDCNISMNVSTGITNISLGSCIDNLALDSSIGDITIITDKEIYTKKHLFKDFKPLPPIVYNGLLANYNTAPIGSLYNQNQVLINVSSNETIQSCSLNFNGTINNGFTINGSNCWITQSISNYGLYNYNVTVISINNGKNITITQSFVNLESMNWFGDGSDGNLLVNSTGIFQDLGSGYNLHPKSVDGMWYSIEDGDVEIVNAQNLIVESGATFTTSNRTRGLIIYVQEDLIVNGTISMTARGAFANPADSGVNTNTPVAPSDGNAVPNEGLVIRRIKSDWTDLESTPSLISNAHANTIDDFNGTHNSSDLFYGAGTAAVLSESNQRNVTNGLVIKIPRVGGTGGPSATVSGDYNDAIPKMFSLAGGGTGQAADSGTYSFTASAGAGGDGTCFSGGSGSGLGYEGHSPDANDYGGPGGQGVTNVGGWMLISGAGNPGGTNANQDGYMYEPEDGTGGLLLTFVGRNLAIGTSGKFESKGVIGGYNNYHPPGYMCGGSSGSGLVGIFYSGNLQNEGSIDVSAVRAGGYSGYYGGGGLGSIIGPIKIDR